MRIAQVDFPDELLDAQRDGELVIFAGAGVSMPAPSKFPNFWQLALQVARGLETRREGESVDRFLGRVKARGIDVHRIVQEILSDRTSSPNSLHFDVLRLFTSGTPVRLVTTNFDMHFSTAAAELYKESGSTFEIFAAPALPEGDSFRGIVYLHGSVEKPCERMVLTDADFGRAYLTAGWARRFLQVLFAHFNVLFIGYSHEDTVMQYLARGLTPNRARKRYALVPDEDRDKWELLGIVPLPYPLRTGEAKYSALPEAVEAWAQLAGSKVLDTEERIKGIVQLPPPADGSSSEYIERALKDLYTTRFFIRYADSPEWLRWAEKKGLLTNLFCPEAQLSAIEIELANWIAESFLFQHFDDALALVQRQGLKFSLGMENLIRFKLFTVKAGDALPEKRAKWLTLLLNRPPMWGSTEYLEFILGNLHFPEDSISALFLFELLTTPQLKLTQDLWKQGGRTVRPEVSIPGTDYHLHEAWEKIFKPNLDRFARTLYPILTNHLLKAHEALRVLGAASDQWDPTSYGRSAIEPHEQDHLRDDFDQLIDSTRDILEWYLHKEPRVGTAIIQEWWRSECPILKRLAVHGVNHCKTLSADEKITWVLERHLLYAFGLQHEVFCLLQGAYPHAAMTTRTSLMREVLAGAPKKDENENDEFRDYPAFNLLVWLHDCDANCQIAGKQLEEMQLKHPSYGRLEKPDLTHWIGPARWGLESPTTVQELLAKAPNENIDWLLSFKGEGPIGPGREGLLETVRGCVSGSFDWGWKLAKVLGDRHGWDADLWGAILLGWQGSNLGDPEWKAVLEFLSSSPDLLATRTREIISLLERGCAKDDGKLPDSCVPQCQQLSDRLWEISEKAEVASTAESDGWLGRAINHPGGQIVQIWLRNLLRQRKPAEQRENKIPPEFKTLFERVVAGNSINAQFGRVVLASQLHLLYWFDYEWAKSWIIPLLDWKKDTVRAAQAWDGYLTWGHCTSPMLPLLLPLYEASYSHLATELSKHRESFCDHMAQIAVFGKVKPVSDGWLIRFLDRVGGEDRVHWASAVDRILRGLDDTQKIALWNDWLDAYWLGRIRGVPSRLEPAEAGAMVGWCTSLGPVFPRVVDRICQSPSPTFRFARVYYELGKSNLPTQYPDAVAKLLIHLLPCPDPNVFDFDELRRIVEALAASHADRHELFRICDELARLGYAGARALRDKIQRASGE
jgi:hypothetical protein